MGFSPRNNAKFSKTGYTKIMDITTDNTLSIIRISSRYIGRCYHETIFHVKSPTPLDPAQIKGLRAAGFLGYGQEFSCSELMNDGSRQPVAEKKDFSRCNANSLFTYECSSRVDSSD
jgi:hypothetical protein